MSAGNLLEIIPADLLDTLMWLVFLSIYHSILFSHFIDVY